MVIYIDNNNIYDKSVLVDELRKNVGMVFQKPIHFQNQFLIMLRMD